MKLDKIQSGEYANKNLTSVIIPDGVVSIGMWSRIFLNNIMNILTN